MSVTETVNQLANAWEEFKVINDRRLKDIENKGAAHFLDNDQLSRINNDLDKCKARLNNIENSEARPAFERSSQLSEKQIIFNNYIRKGIFDQKDIVMRNTPTDGGFPLHETLYEQVMRKLQNNSTMRQIASLETISSDYITFFKSAQDVSAEWETVPNENLPIVTPQSIYTHTLHACPKISQRLLDDAAINIQNWVVENIGEAFSIAENKAFFNGKGDNSPNGILVNPDIQTVDTSAAGKVSADDIIHLYYMLDEVYSRNASFVMHRSTVQHIRSIKSDKTNQYIWQPGLQSNPDTLMGVPIYQSSEMPDVNSGKTIIAFGDFKRGYKIVDRLGINILRDQYSDKPNVAFYASKRVGGAVFDKNAIILLNMKSK